MLFSDSSRLVPHQHAASNNSDDNLIPLINVVFLMLIFFMIAGRITGHDLFPVQPPQSASESDVDTQAVTILLDKASQLAIDNTPVALDDLTEVLSGKLTQQVTEKSAESLAQSITIKADSQLAFAQLQPVLTAVRSAGARRVTLLTIKTP